jgi:hypothetical protein
VRRRVAAISPTVIAWKVTNVGPVKQHRNTSSSSVSQAGNVRSASIGGPLS